MRGQRRFDTRSGIFASVLNRPTAIRRDRAGRHKDFVHADASALVSVFDYVLPKGRRQRPDQAPLTRRLRREGIGATVSYRRPSIGGQKAFAASKADMIGDMGNGRTRRARCHRYEDTARTAG
ncbi:hypothetical protein EMEDMD4_150151 [Sinorhizobium medicae]|uniref:Uncharacterized protein n=1 Tax=Sinorhizobium medicae TaxID=110321 RepID=A0A508WSB6_9HYPH|nr:hypothetical protein EMEDMD4_150151 [Sinorhizobium medicae]